MELWRALATLSEPPAPEHEPIARALGLSLPARSEHTDLFVFQLYPYASVYLGDAGMLGGEPRDRIAGFWRAIGRTPPPEPDHLAVMLATYASLGDACRVERNPIRRDALESAKRAFFGEHLASWLPPYLDKVREIGSPFYRGWAELLAELLEQEPASDRVPSHFRDVAPFPTPECSMSELLSALLSPARSGIILVKGDLRRAARDLGLGARHGERRFVLQALLSQDPARVLGWLAAESRRWAARHAERSGPSARDWETRALRATATLEELARIASASATASAAASGSGTTEFVARSATSILARCSRE